jgi:hypothetical protein
MVLCQAEISATDSSAPTARNVKAWAIGPGWNGQRCGALKARNAKKILTHWIVDISRLQRFNPLSYL